MGNETVSLMLKRYEREADYSPLSTTEVKNFGSIYQFPHMSLWIGAELITWIH